MSVERWISWLCYARNNFPGRHPAIRWGSWVSRAPLGYLVPCRGHRQNAAVVSIVMVWSICVVCLFYPVSEFPPAGVVVGSS